MTEEVKEVIQQIQEAPRQPTNQPTQVHPAGTSKIISALFQGFYNGGLWDNIFWDTHKLPIHLTQNNIAQLYIILGRAKLISCFWNFSVCWLRDASRGNPIYRFPVVHMVKNHFLLENLWIWAASSGILEKFQCGSAVPNIKYNCAILFLWQMY